MKRILLLVSGLVFLAETAISQNPILKPSIGIGPLPSDADSICPIPLYTGSFYASGLQAGDTIADFTLYDLNGDSLNIKSELQKGKPVLLVAGSYTCPVFRNKVPEINTVANAYANDISVFIINVIEAHPDTDISPYFGFVNTHSANISAGILYRQPATYGARKAVVSDMLAAMNIQAPVFIDGPCNNWWQYFGPAPNNSYLIDTNGIVFTKHGWFDKYPDDITCDIDSLLGNTGNCGGTTDSGQFSFTLDGNMMVTGAPGTTIYVKGMLKNNSSKNVLIEIQRIQKNLPPGWESSMCTDVCLATDIDSTAVLLAPNDSQSFTIYFYTDATIDTGMVRIGFRNTSDQSNMYLQNFYGMTDNSFVGIGEKSAAENSVFIFPNPASDYIAFAEGNKPAEINIYNILGEKMDVVRLSSNRIDVKGLPAGVYFIEIVSGENIAVQKFIKR